MSTLSETNDSVMTQHFAKIHEPNRPQRSEVINVQQIKTPEGNIGSTRTSSTTTKKDQNGHTQSIKFTEKEIFDPSQNGHSLTEENDNSFTQNTGSELAKKLSQLGSSGKITVSSKIFKDGEVTTITKTTNFGPKSEKTNDAIKSVTQINGTAGNVSTSRLLHSPSSIKDLLLKWCRDKTVGYKNVDITNFSRCWANGLAFCALIHSYYPDAFEFQELSPTNRRNNLEIAFKTAEEKADIYPLLEVEDMIEMKDHPDWKCIFTYVQSLYKGLRDKKCLNPYDPRTQMDSIDDKNELIL